MKMERVISIILSSVLAVCLLAGCESSTTVVITEPCGILCVAGTWKHAATGSRYHLSQSGHAVYGVEVWQREQWPLEGGLLDDNAIHLTVWAPNAVKQVTGSVHGETMCVTLIYSYHDSGKTDVYPDMTFHRL